MDTIVLLLKENGDTETYKICQKNSFQVLKSNEVSFCGALYEFNAFALKKARVDKKENINIFSFKFPEYFEETYGDILLVGSDDQGQECDIDIDSLKKILNIDQP